jgi:ABC-type lipoprotein export system ATPase subunit
MANDGEPPLIELTAVVKNYGGSEPLKVGNLAVSVRDRVVVSGLGTQAAEMLMHLVCGALLPDEGDVRIDGVSTAAIQTDQQWLRSLDRFGLVSARSILLEHLPAIANLALPLTLSIDPMSDPTRREAERVGALVELGADRLRAPTSSLGPADRLRLHLGRALIQRPKLVLLEHPTDALVRDEDRVSFGQVLAASTSAREAGWLAVSDDEVFARATKGTRRKARGGELTAERSWWRFR